MKISENGNEKIKLSAVELTDRLIDDINNSALIRLTKPDPFFEISVLKHSGQLNPYPIFDKMNICDFDISLSVLSQFINWNEKIVDHNKDEKVEISIFQRDITANKEKIIDVFQELLDDKNLIEADEDIPISEFLTQQLDMLHEAAGY